MHDVASFVHKRIILLALCLLAQLSSSSFLLAQIEKDSQPTVNWPEFRGPDGDGIANGADLPEEFSDDSLVNWKTPIWGKGWSSPVIWGNQIWLTTATEDGKRMSAICVDLESGKIAFERLIHEVSKPAFCHATNSYASPTPVIEDGRVYVHFGSYGTTCLDTQTGNEIWKRVDLPCDHFRGPASSPILFEDLLIVALDGFDKQYVVALDKMTGKTVWKRDRDIKYGTDNGDYKKAYGTGGVFEVKGVPLLVYPSAVATIAYQPKDGLPVWTLYHGGMNVSARPRLTKEGLLIISNGMGKMVAVDPKGKGDITSSNIKWSSTKAVVKKPTPLIINNHLFMVSDKGIASCIKTSDGEVVWRERIGGTFSSSPLFNGNAIFAFSDEGEIIVFKAKEEFELVSRAKFADGFRATPAISGNRLILRSLTDLYCVSK